MPDVPTIDPATPLLVAGTLPDELAGAANLLPAERRASVRLHNYWRTLAGPRRMPRRAQVDLPGPHPAPWFENVFIIRVTPDPKDYVVEVAGPGLRRCFDCNPVGRKVSELMPPRIRDRILFFQRAVVTLRSPIDEAGSWREANGVEMLFRMIVLPLGDDPTAIDYLLGAFTAGPRPVG